MLANEACETVSSADSAETGKVRSWKLAISLAVVAAFAGPLVTGSWRLKPGSWHQLPADERQSIAEMAADSTNCTHFPREETDVGKAICKILLSDLHAGGRWESGEKITWRYAEKNIEAMACAFVLMFAATMLFSLWGPRYWDWLNR